MLIQFLEGTDLEGQLRFCLVEMNSQGKSLEVSRSGLSFGCVRKMTGEGVRLTFTFRGIPSPVSKMSV